jgi:hypothetical protein
VSQPSRLLSAAAGNVQQSPSTIVGGDFYPPPYVSFYADQPASPEYELLASLGPVPQYVEVGHQDTASALGYEAGPSQLATSQQQGLFDGSAATTADSALWTESEDEKKPTVAGWVNKFQESFGTLEHHMEVWGGDDKTVQ